MPADPREPVSPLTRYFLVSAGYVPAERHEDVARLQRMLREAAAVLIGPLEAVAFWSWVSGERDATWLEIPPANEVSGHWRGFCEYAEAYPCEGPSPYERE
jgi:hypothetical protein